MVEAAMVLPVVFLLIFGLMDAGLLFKDYLGAGYATQSAARAGSAAGASALADYDVLQAVGKSRIATGKIERIIVFKAEDNDDKPDQACFNLPVSSSGTLGVTNQCNVYVVDDIDRTPTQYGVGGWISDDAWRGTTREISRSAGTDYVGVTIKTDIATPIGMLGKNPWSVTRTTVVRIEAKES